MGKEPTNVIDFVEARAKRLMRIQAKGRSRVAVGPQGETARRLDPAFSSQAGVTVSARLARGGRSGTDVVPDLTVDQNRDLYDAPGDLGSAREWTEVFDLGALRGEIVSEERRRVRRTILTEFLAAHVVVPDRGLLKVTMTDLSETGLSFMVEPHSGFFQAGEEIAMRIYLNHRTYFPFFGKVLYVRNHEEDGALRHGVQFSSEGINSEALSYFVKFIETVSASLMTDRGDLMVSKIAAE